MTKSAQAEHDHQRGQRSGMPLPEGRATLHESAAQGCLSGYIPFNAVRDLLPEKRSYASIAHWHRVGVLVGGRRIRLKATRLGRKRFTTRAWIEAFLLEMAEADAAAQPKQQAETHAAEQSQALALWKSRK